MGAFHQSPTTEINENDMSQLMSGHVDPQECAPSAKEEQGESEERTETEECGLARSPIISHESICPE